MKSFKVENREFCPICGNNLEALMPTLECSADLDETTIRVHASSPLYLSSADSRSKHHKTGEIFLCENCHELMFLYTECDCRSCGRCQHYKQLERTQNYGCSWFDIDCNEVSGYSRDMWSYTHCKNIDKPPVKINDKYKCFLCKYYSSQILNGTEYGECTAKMPFQRHLFGESAVNFKNNKACMEFDPDFNRYKKYKDTFKDMLFLPEDMIKIPEFDKLIDEKNHEQKD